MKTPICIDALKRQVGQDDQEFRRRCRGGDIIHGLPYPKFTLGNKLKHAASIKKHPSQKRKVSPTGEDR